MKKIKLIFHLFFIAIAYSGFSQLDTEIYLFDFTKNKNGQYTLSNPIKISKNEGYNNQPLFSEDGASILYSSNRNGQTEIAQYSLVSKETKILTSTLFGSEYSPTPAPNHKISSVRLDTTGLQLLYLYDEQGNWEVLVEDVTIGYHEWISENSLIAFVLGTPPTLQFISLSKDENRVIATNIGRSLHKIPNSNWFSYVDKSSKPWKIVSANSKNKKKKTLTTVIDESEDFCWTPFHEILMGSNSELFIWQKLSGWNLLANVESFGLSDISRLTVSSEGNKLVMVVSKK